MHFYALESNFLTMKIPQLIALTLSLSLNAIANTDIYVSYGEFSPPFYQFYSDSDGTIPLDIIGEDATESLVVGETYTFRRIDEATTHPFALQPGATSTTSISGGSSIIGTQTLVVNINDDQDLTYLCTAHSFMTGTINVTASSLASNPKVGTSELFSSTTNDNWPYVITISPAGTAGSSHQVMINITSLPEGGANIRWPRTVANGNWYMGGNGTTLSEGINTLTLPEVAFDRTVKMQFSSGNVEFSSLTRDGTTLYGDGGYSFVAPAGSVLASTIFDGTGNSSWPYSLASVTADDSDSNAQQVFTLNITELPEGGASYSIAKTVANGNWDSGAAQALALGENTIVVAGVDFLRSVKLRISSDIAVDALSANGVYALGESPSDDDITVDADSVRASSLFDASGNSAWPYTLTAVTSVDGVDSQSQQVFNLNITSLPSGGAQYSVYKTTSNGNDWVGNGIDLQEGENIITIAGVSFDRSVKLRISADVALDNISINNSPVFGESLSIPIDSVAASSVFDQGDNAAWPLAINDPDFGTGGIASNIPQHFLLNITALPSEGAKYSIAKTVENGNWDFGAAQDLVLGENLISVDRVDFQRSVKLRLSTDVAIDALSVNGTYSVGTSPVHRIDPPGYSTTIPTATGWFNGSPNPAYPLVLNRNIVTPADGPLSQTSQIYVINVTDLPPGGAKASIARTVANGNWDIIEKDLVIGLNFMHLRAVDFDRSVKFRLSTPHIAFDYIAYEGGDELGDDRFERGKGGLINYTPDGLWDDNDSDGIYNFIDAFPEDSSEYIDADNDGVGANSDPDDNDSENPNPSITESPKMSVIVGDNHFLFLSWTPITGTSYTLKSAENPGGPYTTIISDAQNELDGQNRLSLGPISGEGVFVGPSSIPLGSEYNFKGFFKVEAE